MTDLAIELFAEGGPALLLLALVIDAIFGDPPALYRHLPHPVALIGNAIAALERMLNRPTVSATIRRSLGVGALVLVLAGAGGVGWMISHALSLLQGGWVGEALIASTLLAQNSLHAHVRDVARGLRRSLAEGREAVSRIVGRDPDSLDEAAVARAAVESAAENFSDGVVAPVLAYLLLGLPGLFLYKALNTADSMIGHLNERHREFGWAAARLDDLANWIPARLSALLFCLAALPLPDTRAVAGLTAAVRDAGRHRSVNAGWPEAAMAGVLGLRLAGPRRYGTERVEDAWMGDGRADLTAADIERALRLYLLGCLGLWVLIAGVWAILRLI